MMNRRKLLVSIASAAAFGSVPSIAFAQTELRRKFRGDEPAPVIEEEVIDGSAQDEKAGAEIGRVERKRRGEGGAREVGQQAPVQAPSATQIERSLDAAPRRKIRRADQVRRKDFGRDLRRRSTVRENIRIAAPSIDIQAINFEFGSARIPIEEQWKVEEIAIAMRRLLRRNPDEVFLIEGHTDAVGSNYSNQLLSEDRAASLKRVLVRQFGVDAYALETIGYGEDYLLVRTSAPEWRNRRVTLRTVTDFMAR